MADLFLLVFYTWKKIVVSVTYVLTTKAHKHVILSAGSIPSCAVAERRHECNGLIPVDHSGASGTVTGPELCPILQHHIQPALVPASGTGKLEDNSVL